jgi:hypothetical protein
VNDHLETTSVFKGTSLAIQNDLIKAIHKVMLDDTSRQIREAPYVAVILDETSDIHMVSQLQYWGASIVIKLWKDSLVSLKLVLTEVLMIFSVMYGM